MEDFDTFIKNNREVLKAIRAASLKEGYDKGFVDGYTAGEMVGFVAAVEQLEAAVSDGLRHGSSECGRVLQGIGNLKGKS